MLLAKLVTNKKVNTNRGSSMKSFNEIIYDVTKFGRKIKTSDYMGNGKYPIIDQGKNLISGYTNEENGIFVDVPAIIFGDHTRILKYIDTPFFLGADGTKILKAKNENCNLKFIYYALKNIKIPDTGYNRHYKWLKESSIIYPAIEHQDKIVNILDRITSIITLKKQQLVFLEKLKHSLFVEMFINENYPKKKLGECAIINPKKSSDKRLHDELEVSFVPMMAVGGNGHINVSEIKKLADVKNGFTYFSEGDVLFAKITPCMENGKGAIASNLCNGIGFGSTEFHVIRPIENITTSEWIYVLTTLQKFRLSAEANMTGSAGQKRVPASFLQDYSFYLPPIELQKQFSRVFKHLDKHKSVVQKSLDETQLLFDSLMQKYFG